MLARAWGPLCATLLLFVGGSARAFNVPKQTDYVTDTAGSLSPAELSDLNNRLGDYERKSGNQIFVLVTPSLEGEPIEDVGYQLIQTWKPGQKGKDNGVVLVIATGERRIRIETGKGVGGDLTDLQSNDIIRRRIAPLMRGEPGARRHPRWYRRNRRGALGHRHHPPTARSAPAGLAAGSGGAAALVRPLLLGLHPLRRGDAAAPREQAPATPHLLGRPPVDWGWWLGRGRRRLGRRRRRR